MALSLRLRDFAASISAHALDLLFPPQCAGCGLPGHEFCDRCAQNVEPLPATICPRCGIPQKTVHLCSRCRQSSFPIAVSRAAALHTTPLREAIHALKYDGRPELAQPLSRYLVAVFQQHPWQSLAPRIDAVVPAPLHPDRLRERGYNQSELLAEHFANACHLPLQADWLERIRATRQQVGLNAAERQQNVFGAFRASPAVAGHTLLVIDDVFTTGATLSACADAALVAGASEVYALTLAIPNHAA